MSQMFMPPGPDAGAPPPGAGPPPDAGAGNPLVAAMGAGPGGGDLATMPPALMAALGGGAQPPTEEQGEPAMEPASIEAAMEHIQMGLQMLQELQVGETDNMKMQELSGMISPLTKMLGDRQKSQQMAAASMPGGGGGGGNARG